MTSLCTIGMLVFFCIWVWPVVLANGLMHYLVELELEMGLRASKEEAANGRAS